MGKLYKLNRVCCCRTAGFSSLSLVQNRQYIVTDSHINLIPTVQCDNLVNYTVDVIISESLAPKCEVTHVLCSSCLFLVLNANLYFISLMLSNFYNNVFYADRTVSYEQQVGWITSEYFCQTDGIRRIFDRHLKYYPLQADWANQDWKNIRLKNKFART